MNYEQKYKEALERARKLYNDAKVLEYTQDMEDYETIFPELKESEDERIRKELIDAINGLWVNDALPLPLSVGRKDKWIAWLEKQGEQKVPINDFKAKNWYVSEVDGKIHDMTYNPADKVEPKFKVGDWIANDYCTGKVIALTDDAYLLDSGQGIPFSCEHNTHLWTIQDAKDGDVLIDKSHVGECVFIFKEARPSDIKTDVNNPLAIIGYCGINHIGFTSQLSGLGFGDTVNCTYYPATKEQRELLFQKMKEAGYQWDAKKKELKLLISNGGDFESNNSKQKPTWSEDDERIVTALLEGFRYHQLFNPRFGEVPNAEIISWIKSLKERLS